VKRSWDEKTPLIRFPKKGGRGVAGQRGEEREKMRGEKMMGGIYARDLKEGLGDPERNVLRSRRKKGLEEAGGVNLHKRVPGHRGRNGKGAILRNVIFRSLVWCMCFGLY